MKKVKSMSFEEKSRWLRCNPVTAAKHLSVQIEYFFFKMC